MHFTCRIGITVVLAVVIQVAEALIFEYRYQNDLAENLPYQGLDKSAAYRLKYELVNPMSTQTLEKLIEHKAINYTIPGINVTLSDWKNPEVLLTSDVTFMFPLYRLSVDFTVSFINKQRNKCVEIRMNLFNAPTEEISKEHAKINDVPTIVSPFSEEQLETMYERTGKCLRPHVLSYILCSDITLKKAVYMGKRLNRGMVSYVYSTGPVILEEHLFDEILGL